MQKEYPEAMFTRQDNQADEIFYEEPRFVTHIDRETINEITSFYEESLPENCIVLDLMSSWVSHLPPKKKLKKVVGLGMNLEELSANQQLDEYLVHNLNSVPDIPLETSSFDIATIVVSIQYLTRPYEVFRSIFQLLKPGGQCLVMMSHRLFPTKAIYAFQVLSAKERIDLVTDYLEKTGFRNTEFIDRSPKQGDPLWIVRGHKKKST
ncbi:MAG: methyltransferase type 11 [Gammaproteobacteria bacterium]|nr:methyltransferase type 11 [Gammaproteobacteria bacterium]